MATVSTRIAAQAAFSQDVGKLLAWCHLQGYYVTLGEAWRTPFQQAEYMRTGRSKTLKSRHLDRMAIDLNFFSVETGKMLTTTAEIAPIGKYWESLSPKNRWGGNFDKDWGKEDNFKDAPHFERTD